MTSAKMDTPIGSLREINRRSADIFREKYEGKNSDWGNSSGPGSNPYYTIEYQSLVSRFIVMNKIRSVVDIGCGDWGFSRFINFDYCGYLGLDVVPNIIESNKINFANDRRKFAIMPTKLSDVPAADLLLMKDVLQHLSNSEIMAFRDLVFQKFKYCLLTNSFEKLGTPRNIDIPTGAFRCIDLTAPPYNFEGCYILEFGSAVWERIRVLLLSPMIKAAQDAWTDGQLPNPATFAGGRVLLSERD